MDTETITALATPHDFTFDYTNITSIVLSTVSETTLDNIDLILSNPGTSFASLSGLDANQRGIASSIDSASTGSSNAISRVTTALGSLPVTNVAGALDQLAPTKFHQFASSTAFNNEVFAVQDMDDYLDSERTRGNGSFAGGNGQIDTHNFVVEDANVDPGPADDP